MYPKKKKKRLKPLLSSLISSLQIAFVPGKKGTENVVIAQELLYYLNKKKGKDEGGFMIIKIDLEKPFVPRPLS